MQVGNYGQGVRRVHSGYELVCEYEQNGEWVRFATFHEISNDYAYSESNDACHAKARERARAVQTDASTEADELFHLWKHLGTAGCAEQIEAHMESAGYSQSEIDAELERLSLDANLYEIVVTLPHQERAQGAA